MTRDFYETDMLIHRRGWGGIQFGWVSRERGREQRPDNILKETQNPEKDNKKTLLIDQTLANTMSNSGQVFELTHP